ncbi:MAG: gamma-glutamyltransferase [Flavobacteriales bacterium]|nr:gamma-glutamyltransferase [Flavobacteriales bacterium]
MHKTLSVINTLRKIIISILLISLGCIPLFKCKKKNTSKKHVASFYTHEYMAVSARKEASEIGALILEKGGNAFDAAIAMHFVLAVTYPQAGNIGGGGFMVAQPAGENPVALDFREQAPAKAQENIYLDQTGNVIPGKSVIGHRASGIPGSVMGMYEIHQRFGTMPWSKLIQPAIYYAQHGFVLTEKDVLELQEVIDELDSINGPNVFTCNKWQAGDTLKQPELAKTLKRIAHHGPDDFYRGETSRLIIQEMQTHGNWIDSLDLRNYKAIWRTPLKGTFYNYEIITMPPPSSGGIALLQILFMLEKWNIHTIPFQSLQQIITVAEAEKMAYADRSKYLGDPDFVDVPTDSLLSKSYLMQRLNQFGIPSKSTPSARIKPGIITGYESEETTHFSVIDNKGNAVSITTTINSAYGSRVIVKDAGFIMNNEMDDFSIKPGIKNQFGLIGGKANAIQPGKRMLSSMTPTLVKENGNIKLIVGSPGGATIITTVLQQLLNVLIYKQGMQESCNQPRFHHQWVPDILYLEETWKEKQELLDSLKMAGYTIQFRPPIGRVSAILRTQDNRWEAGVDQRGDNAAAGK